MMAEVVGKGEKRSEGKKEEKKKKCQKLE